MKKTKNKTVLPKLQKKPLCSYCINFDSWSIEKEKLLCSENIFLDPSTTIKDCIKFTPLLYIWCDKNNGRKLIGACAFSNVCKCKEKKATLNAVTKYFKRLVPDKLASELRAYKIPNVKFLTD